MDSTQLEECLEVSSASVPSSVQATKVSLEADQATKVSLEAEIPEELYKGMKSFISTNPKWDQYTLMSAALANFLFQNGCEDRVVTERYLNDLFTRTSG